MPTQPLRRGGLTFARVTLIALRSKLNQDGGIEHRQVSHPNRLVKAMEGRDLPTTLMTGRAVQRALDANQPMPRVRLRHCENMNIGQVERDVNNVIHIEPPVVLVS
jgi:hypothetical protein